MFQGGMICGIVRPCRPSLHSPLLQEDAASTTDGEASSLGPQLAAAAAEVAQLRARNADAERAAAAANKVLHPLFETSP